MKIPSIKWLALAAVGLISAALAQSKYSGIYSGNESSGGKFLAAVTKGGRVLAIDSTTKGIRTAINPAKSTVDESGHLKGATNTGDSLDATISSDFKVQGTFKSDDGTMRLSGRRIYH